MTMNLSFVSSPLRFVPILATGMVVLVVMLLMVSISAIVEGSATRSELTRIKLRLAKAQSELTAMPTEKSDELPTSEQLEALRQRVALTNRLTGGHGRPLLSLLIQVEKLMPDSARLVSLHYLQDTGVSTLIAEAESNEVLTEFLQRLEQSQQFSEVLLVRQAQQVQHGRSARQFELRLKERA